MYKHFTRASSFARNRALLSSTSSRGFSAAGYKSWHRPSYYGHHYWGQDWRRGAGWCWGRPRGFPFFKVALIATGIWWFVGHKKHQYEYHRQHCEQCRNSSNTNGNGNETWGPWEHHGSWGHWGHHSHCTHNNNNNNQQGPYQQPAHANQPGQPVIPAPTTATATSTKPTSILDAYNPDTKQVDWFSPALGNLPHGPCGADFQQALSCFVHSEKNPKGAECLEKFSALQTCFAKYPQLYEKQLKEGIF